MARRVTLSIGLVLLMFVVGASALRPDVATGLPPQAARGDRGPLMTASTQQLGHAAYRAAPGAPGAWLAQDQTTGAWLQLDQPRASLVRRVVITRTSDTAAGVRAGYLQFSDGSVVHVRLTGTTTALPVTPRLASSVRFVVTQVDPGAAQAGLAEIALEGKEADTGGVATTGPADGNLAPLADVSSIGAAPIDGGGSSLSALVDGDPSTTASTGDGVQLDWARPREVTGIAVTGAVTGAVLKRASVVFSDGSTLPLGGVTHDTTRPTVVSFMISPYSDSLSLRLHLTA